MESTKATETPVHSHFDAEEERELRQEDSSAWHDIVKILLGIIAMGVVLAIVCVILTLTIQ
jgi:hypothetical protein